MIEANLCFGLTASSYDPGNPFVIIGVNPIRVHVSDMKVMGYKLTSDTPRKMGEARALQIQKSDPTFSKTGSEFQAGINGYVKWLKLQPITLPGIQKPFK